MDTFVSRAQASGNYIFQGQTEPVFAQGVPCVASLQRQKVFCECAWEHFSLPGLRGITDCCLYRDFVRCFVVEATAFLQIGYGVTLRYINECGEEISQTKTGSLFFVGLPEAIRHAVDDFVLPNPCTVEQSREAADVLVAALIPV